MRKVMVIFLILFATALTAQNFTSAVIDVGYAPFLILEGRNVTGMYVDLIDEFLRQYPNYNIAFRILPRARVDVEFDRGDVDFMWLNSPLFMGDRAEHALFSDQVWVTGDRILMHRSNTFPFKKYEDLFGKNIGMLRGFSNPTIEPHVAAGNIIETRVNTTLQLYSMLQVGRIDGAVGNIHVAPYSLIQQGFNLEDFVFTEKATFEFAFHKVAQKQDKHRQFLEDFNAFLREAREPDGILSQIEQKWLSQ